MITAFYLQSTLVSVPNGFSGTIAVLHNTDDVIQPIDGGKCTVLLALHSKTLELI